MDQFFLNTYIAYWLLVLKNMRNIFKFTGEWGKYLSTLESEQIDWLVHSFFISAKNNFNLSWMIFKFQPKYCVV